MKIPEILLSETTIIKLIKVVVILFVGLLGAKILKSLSNNFIQRYRHDGRPSFIPNLIFYFVLTIVIFIALDRLNVDVKILLGTAGFLTVALGFASQTSVSNIISGFFLMTEKPFTIGDTVKINELTGVILSIDLLSTRLRTVDNLLVRIPNETLMKANIINYTHFPLRRVDIDFRIEHRENIEKVKNVLFELAQHHPLCFDEPRPLFILKEIGEWFVLAQFSFWVEKDQFLDGKNSFIERMMIAFEKNNINLPVPMRAHLTPGIFQDQERQ